MFSSGSGMVVVEEPPVSAMAERWSVEDFGGGKRGVMGILEGALVPLYLYNIKRMGNLPHVFFSELNFILFHWSEMLAEGKMAVVQRMCNVSGLPAGD